MNKLKIFLFNSILITAFNCQAQLYPILENEITFCYFCTQKNVIDKVWRFEDEIYTKLKTENFEYELFRLTDTTFHIRKFESDTLIEKGDILLKMENKVRGDTITCLDCDPVNTWQEIIRIYYFINPVKIGKWQFTPDKYIKESGSFDNNENKIGSWRYETKDSILYTNYDTNEFYYVRPNKEIVKSNEKWLYKKFYLNHKSFFTRYEINQDDTIREIITNFINRSSIRLNPKRQGRSELPTIEFKKKWIIGGYILKPI